METRACLNPAAAPVHSSLAQRMGRGLSVLVRVVATFCVPRLIAHIHPRRVRGSARYVSSYVLNAQVLGLLLPARLVHTLPPSSYASCPSMCLWGNRQDASAVRVYVCVCVCCVRWGEMESGACGRITPIPETGGAGVVDTVSIGLTAPADGNFQANCRQKRRRQAGLGRSSVRPAYILLLYTCTY